MNAESSAFSPLYHWWNLGQQRLAAGRYVSARRALETAERMAWKSRDFRSLARVYLPLLEARRQIRQNAADGRILYLSASRDVQGERRKFREFLQQPAGTLLIECFDRANVAKAGKLAARVYFSSQRTGGWLEALLLLRRNAEWRLVPLASPRFSSGLPVMWTRDATAIIGPSTDMDLVVPLPLIEDYKDGSLHTVARESLLIAWEALALRWQHQHPPTGMTTPHGELAWLRRTLEIDPACEPVAMRLIALAEALDRGSQSH